MCGSTIQGAAQEGSKVYLPCHPFLHATWCLLQMSWPPLNKDPKLLKEKEQVVKAQSLPIIDFKGKSRGKKVH